MTGWSPHRDRKGWASTRQRILTRDQHVCYQCGAHANEVDHITPLSQHGTEHDDNLAAICNPCHKTKTAREANQARRTKYTRQRQPEPHPGRLQPD